MKKHSPKTRRIVLIVWALLALLLLTFFLSAYYYNKHREDRATLQRLREQICNPKTVDQISTDNPTNSAYTPSDDRFRPLVQNFGGTYGGNGISSTLERSVEPDMSNISEFCKE